MNQQIILVICGNAREFHFHVREKIMALPEIGVPFVYKKNVHRCDIGRNSYRWISMPDQLRGYRGVKVEWWGTWQMIPKERLALFHALAKQAQMPR